MNTLRHSGIWTPEDRGEAPYRYLDFEVPGGATVVSVSLEYDGEAGILDLGCEGPGGWRGWSGGARRAFAIGAELATPGYVAGPLEPGVWRVVLGLHRVAAGGVAWQVEVDVATGRSRPAIPGLAEAPLFPVPGARGGERQPRHAARRLPAPPGTRWLAGDLHAHTVHSDGVLTVDELAGLAAGRGLDFLAVTDHNTVSHHAELAAAGRRAGVTLVPGQEVTTSLGHANAFGDIGWVDFREPAASWAATVRERGGLLSVNHPLAGDCCWRQPLPQPTPLAEVWHSSWRDRAWGGPLAWWQAWSREWAVGVVPLGGSDFHRHGEDAPPGSPTTWVASEADGGDASRVLTALAAGRVAVSAGVDGPLLLRIGGDLVAVDADGALLTGPDGRRRPVRGDRVTFPDTPGPHWLEDGRTAVLALSP